MNNFLKNKHLISRAGFGIHHNDIEKYKNTSHKNLYQELKTTSEYQVLQTDVKSVTSEKYLEMVKANDSRKSVNLFNRLYNASIRKSWHNQMINTPNQLREKMALFWHGHFSTRIQHGLYNKEIVEIFRKNSFENFLDLVFEVSKSSAMLNFLNNQQNKKIKPNE